MSIDLLTDVEKILFPEEEEEMKERKKVQDVLTENERLMQKVLDGPKSVQLSETDFARVRELNGQIRDIFAKALGFENDAELVRAGYYARIDALSGIIIRKGL
jgi:hypothetical protein